MKRRLKAMAIFEEAMVAGYGALIPSMANHEKDRHVVAAAIVAGAQTIVTENIRHFPEAALAPYGLSAKPSDDFLAQQCCLYPQEFLAILVEQATFIGGTLSNLLVKLRAEKLQGLIRL